VAAAPDAKALRVLEHVVRSLSHAVDDIGGACRASSVFSAAAMSDFGLSLPAAPEELVALVLEYRERLVGEDGIVDQLAGIADLEGDSTRSNSFLATSHELVEETSDILALRALISSREKVNGLNSASIEPQYSFNRASKEPQ